MKKVITIDGPSGAGKSTISKMLAMKLGYTYLDTGALYRAVALKASEREIDIEDETALKELLDSIDVRLKDEKIYVNGEDVTGRIRTAEMGELSSRISAKPLVRNYLYTIQREAGMRGSVVMEGRDTGTIIFPEASHKFYLDADIKVRASRRSLDLKDTNQHVSLEETLRDLKKRDTRDATRLLSPLKKTADMMYIDSSDLTIDEVVRICMESIAG